MKSRNTNLVVTKLVFSCILKIYYLLLSVLKVFPKTIYINIYVYIKYIYIYKIYIYIYIYYSQKELKHDVGLEILVIYRILEHIVLKYFQVYILIHFELKSEKKIN